MIKVKVCGLSRKEDVLFAQELGANYFGFIVYPESLRAVQMIQVEQMLDHVPAGKAVMVDVMPDPQLLKDRCDYFDLFQIHFPGNAPQSLLEKWSKIVGKERLWLAPKIVPDSTFPTYLLEYADTFVMDTYSPNKYGGTGKTGDWEGYKELKTQYPEKTWILAGGLNPDNLKIAVEQTGSDFVDINSGVEAEPGIKDANKLRKAFDVLDTLA